MKIHAWYAMDVYSRFVNETIYIHKLRDSCSRCAGQNVKVVKNSKRFFGHLEGSPIQEVYYRIYWSLPTKVMAMLISWWHTLIYTCKGEAKEAKQLNGLE
jgi:hypothetical protein